MKRLCYNDDINGIFKYQLKNQLKNQLKYNKYSFM